MADDPDKKCAQLVDEIAARALAAVEEAPDRLTLDTDLVRDYWQDFPRRWAIERLLELAEAGEVDLAVTRYIRADIPDAPLRDRLDELPELKVRETGGLFTFGVSRLDGPDVFGDAAMLSFENAIAATWKPSKGKPPDSRDWKHLHTHYALGRVRFLTWDRGLLELGELLEPIFRLGVVRPDDYLRERGEKAPTDSK